MLIIKFYIWPSFFATYFWSSMYSILMYLTCKVELLKIYIEMELKTLGWSSKIYVAGQRHLDQSPAWPHMWLAML